MGLYVLWHCLILLYSLLYKFTWSESLKRFQVQLDVAVAATIYSYVVNDIFMNKD